MDSNIRQDMLAHAARTQAESTAKMANLFPAIQEELARQGEVLDQILALLNTEPETVARRRNKSA